MLSSKESSSIRHPASLIDISAHDPHLVRLMGSRVNMEMVDYIARQAANVVSIEGESPIVASSVVSMPSPNCSYNSAASLPLRDYIAHLVRQAHVQVPTLLATLIYLERLRTKLPILTRGTTPCTRHRVFLATLVVAAKYLNDSTLKNKHWAHYALFFTVEEITLMETQLLGFLDYDLRFDEEEACHMFAPFMTTPAQRASARALAIDKVAKAGRARVQAQQTPEPFVEPDLPSLPSRASSSGLATTVRTLANRLSNNHLSARSQSNTSAAAWPMYTTLSTSSTISTSSSDVGSLIEDTGSSSGSSSGWNTSDSESESEEHIEPCVYSNSSLNLHPRADSMSERLIKPSAFVRSVPSYTQKTHQIRSRKPSDTSSICTITQSPSISAPRRCSAKRSASISVTATEHSKDAGMSSSVTMPSISRGTSGNFLTRMWGVARGQALEGDASSAFRKLVLAHSRPSLSRGSTVDV